MNLSDAFVSSIAIRSNYGIIGYQMCIRDRTPSRRRSPIFWVPTAYFGMGLPFVVLNMVAVLMYKGLGVRDAKIAFWTSLIMLPWTLKPLWSPLLEMYRTKKFFVVLTPVSYTHLLAISERPCVPVY